MKKMFYGVLSLLVPMALVLYTVNIIGSFAVLFAVLTMVAIAFYTANKFHLVGKKRGYGSLTDALCYAAIGNTAWAFVYVLLMFIGAKIFVDGFGVNPFRFNPLLGVMSYMCILGVIACIAYLVTHKGLDDNRKAFNMFISMFTLALMAGCVFDLLKPYGVVVPDTETLSAIMLISALGTLFSGYFIKRKEYA